jgi:hypothetical protein
MTYLAPGFALSNLKLQKRISGMEDWTRPKEEVKHWKAGRSAMEQAHSWFRSGALAFPAELGELLASSPLVAQARFIEGAPEFVTGLPQQGEGRNHDLWLRGEAGAKGITVCVEAKADESFDRPLHEALEEARTRNERTGLPARAAALLAILFGGNPQPDEMPWRDLRYQLITAAAGTVIQARLDHSGIALLLIQEFATRSTKTENIARNAADYEAFTSLLFANASSGRLRGPVMLRSTQESEIAFMMGKVTVPLAKCAPEE